MGRKKILINKMEYIKIKLKRRKENSIPMRSG
jgi:hypothetical protein